MSNKTRMVSLLTPLLILAVAATAIARTRTQNNATTAAPIPPQIAAAKKVFVTNAGWNCIAVDLRHNNPNQAYDEFYAGMKAWGHYDLVSGPDQADLDFEVAFACPPEATDVSSGNSFPWYDAEVILTVIQPKGNVLIWRIVQLVRPNPRFQGAAYHNQGLTETITTLIGELKVLGVRSSAPTPPASSMP